MIKPSRPEIGNWKLNVARNQGSGPKQKVTFDMLSDSIPGKSPLQVIDR
jgi:hypothetical protein